MSKLDKFMADAPGGEALPEGMPFYAVVACQTCSEAVGEQMYYPTDSVLVWACSAGHRSIMENFSVF